MNLPAEKGVYALVFELENQAVLMVGKLGFYPFEPGQYIYFGSANGSGGLRARLNHHLSQVRKAHWHIDALSRVASPHGICYAAASQYLECVWCQHIQRAPGAYLPVPGFGASDCGTHCSAHLVGVRPSIHPDLLRSELELVSAGQAVVCKVISGREN